MSRPAIGILTGPTATGKTAHAIRLARAAAVPIEIINADSMLVYRGMDIGTAKPTQQERQGVPHHLIDICEPNEPFTAGEFVRATEAAIRDIESRGARALIVGGTGFYLKALLYGMWDAPKADPALRARLEAKSNEELHASLATGDAAAAARIGPQDRYRLVRALELIELSGKTPTELQAQARTEPDPRFTLWVLDRGADSELNARIHARTRQMLEQGLIEETRSLRSRFPAVRALSAVGYSQACDFLDGKAPAGRKLRPGINGLADEIELGTRQLVKSQRTWFRGQKSALWFRLEADLSRLEQAFQAIYPLS